MLFRSSSPRPSTLTLPGSSHIPPPSTHLQPLLQRPLKLLKSCDPRGGRGGRGLGSLGVCGTGLALVSAAALELRDTEIGCSKS